MSQTSAPKRRVITLAVDLAEGEVQSNPRYAVWTPTRTPRRYSDAHNGTRLRAALIKRLVRRAKRLNGGTFPLTTALMTT